VTSFLREPFVEGDPRDPEEEHPVQTGGMEQAIGELVTCSRCVGTWAAAGLATTQVLAPRFGRLLTWTLAGAAVSDFLQAGFVALTGKANELGALRLRPSDVGEACHADRIQLLDSTAELAVECSDGAVATPKHEVPAVWREGHVANRSRRPAYEVELNRWPLAALPRLPDACRIRPGRSQPTPVGAEGNIEHGAGVLPQQRKVHP
jgi:hypothetical protein